MLRPPQLRRALPALLAAVLVVSMVAPAGALAATESTADSPVAQTATADATTTATTATPANETDDEGESDDGVSAGYQLSTVLSVTSDEVQTEVENAGFESAFADSDDEDRAEAIAERASELRERSAEIREAYREASEAYREGELTRVAYAQRIAVLNARANHVAVSYDQLAVRAETVSALELRAAGVNVTELRAAGDDLDSVRGTGATALRQRFVGERNGTFAVNATENGLSIEVEDDEEVAREFERSRDDDDSMTVSQTDALATAREQLSTPADGSWALDSASVDAEEGYYEFEFELRNAADAEGETEVRVDGSSGDVFRLKEEYERESDDEDERERESDDEDERERESDDEDADDERDDLTLLVTSGTVAPNETVTIQVRTAGGDPADGVPVRMNGEPVGTTGADGTVTVTLPESGEVEIEAEERGADAELEVELGGDEETERRQIARQLQTSASVVNGNASVSVSFNGSPVSNATVYVDGEAVGTTDENGEITFTTETTEDLDVRIVKGNFSSTISFGAENGLLSMQTVTVGGERDADDEDDEDDEKEETDDEDDADDDVDVNVGEDDEDEEVDVDLDEDEEVGEDDEDDENDEDDTTTTDQP